MREALPVVVCGNCGAPAKEKARRCEFCRVEIRTRRCARCYHLNALMLIHCGGCGYELGLEPIPESARLSCPACKATLMAFTDASGRLYDCPECGGQFLEPSTFKGLVRDAAFYLEPSPLQVPRQNPLSEPVRYRACPLCGDLMHRKNFGGSSGVIIDICHRHGTWLDAGELPLILSFVRAGGLELEARRNAEERRVAQSARSVDFVPVQPTETVDVDLLSIAAVIGRDIARFIREVWKP